MERTYKLAANFNTVEFKISRDDLLEVADFDTEVYVDEESLCPVTMVSDEELIKRILQREYDILAGINVVNVAPPVKTQVKEIDPPSEKQAKFAEALGMKDAAKRDKKEVWKFIQDHKDQAPIR